VNLTHRLIGRRSSQPGSVTGFKQMDTSGEARQPAATAEPTARVGTRHKEIRMKLIWGREPALILAAIGAVLTLLAALNVPGVNTGAAAAITVFITACVMAWATSPPTPALFTGIVAAGTALLAEYGLDLPDATVAAASATVLALFALISRGQVSPAPARVRAGSRPAQPVPDGGP
jgi:hypothetical protein